jgi:hypothetical protein
MDIFTSPSLISTYNNESCSCGIQFIREISWKKDPHRFFLHSNNTFFNSGMVTASIVKGWQYERDQISIGCNFAYDLFSFPTHTQHQLSYGFELIQNIVNLQIRKYYPIPINKYLNYGKERYKKVHNFYRTDIDLLLDHNPLTLGFGFYFDKEFVGHKVIVKYEVNDKIIGINYRFDNLQKHSIEVSVGWAFFSGSKKYFNYNPYIVYKKTKFEPFLLSFPPTPFLVDLPEEKAPFPTEGTPIEIPVEPETDLEPIVPIENPPLPEIPAQEEPARESIIPALGIIAGLTLAALLLANVGRPDLSDIRENPIFPPCSPSRQVIPLSAFSAPSTNSGTLSSSVMSDLSALANPTLQTNGSLGGPSTSLSSIDQSIPSVTPVGGPCPVPYIQLPAPSPSSRVGEGGGGNASPNSEASGGSASSSFVEVSPEWDRSQSEPPLK